MTFTENWFHETACDVLSELAQRTRHLQGDVVEVGSWEGKSTIVLAQAVFPALVHAVDTWEGSPGEPSADLARERDVYATFTRNCALAGPGNIVPHRQTWQDYFETHRNPCRFVFIDAEHTYEQVRANIETVLPLMVRGGILCGDDIHHIPVRQAVVDCFGDTPYNGPVWAHQC